MKIAAKGVVSRVVVRVRKFLSDPLQKVTVGGQLSGVVTVKSWVSQESVLSPLLFLEYVNDIWRNLYPTITLYADTV